MNIVISSNTIKSKRQKIIKDQYTTPVKQIFDATPTKINPEQTTQATKQKSSTIKFTAEKDMPPNVFKKNCFQRGRNIKTIDEIHDLHESRNLSSSKYRFKPQFDKSQSMRSNLRDSIKTYKRSKSKRDKMPTNMLAHQESVMSQQNSRVLSSNSSRHNLSLSKTIKDKIIKY